MSMENLTDKEAKKLIDFHKKHGDTPQLSKEGQTEGVKHTPGPWKIKRVNNPVFNSIRHFEIRDQSSHLGLLIAQINSGCSDDEANAALIASAPTLKAENQALKGENDRLREALIEARKTIMAYTVNILVDEACMLEGEADEAALKSEVIQQIDAALSQNEPNEQSK